MRTQKLIVLCMILNYMLTCDYDTLPYTELILILYPKLSEIFILSPNSEISLNYPST